MNDEKDTTGKWIIMAGFAIVTAAITTALIHKPTRKRIKNVLEDSIDATDKKFDEIESQTRKFAEYAERNMNKARSATIKEMKDRLATLQEKLDDLS